MISNFVANEDLNAVLVFADGKCFFGSGIGVRGKVTGEICFNVAMTGYQETLTDPSYAGQIINFAYPHIGNVGTNQHDNEKSLAGASGLVIRNPITPDSNYRSQQAFDQWLVEKELTGICGVDTRAVIRYIRLHGPQMCAIVYADAEQTIDIDVIVNHLSKTPSLMGKDLAIEVTSKQDLKIHTQEFDLGKEYYPQATELKYKVVALDFGIKQNILHCCTQVGLDVVTVPANASLQDILEHEPDGVFLSNGPADPFAVAEYAVHVISELLAIDMPIFGICMGHQLLSIACGLDTIKMKQGHRGINHPVKNMVTGKVEITSQNHGFCASSTHIPAGVKVTHRSLFDDTIAGIEHLEHPAFSVQYHPESSPGPHDSAYLFTQFAHLIETSVQKKQRK